MSQVLGVALVALIATMVTCDHEETKAKFHIATPKHEPREAAAPNLIKSARWFNARTICIVKIPRSSAKMPAPHASLSFLL